MPVFDENVQAIAKETLLPKVVDSVLNSNVLTARVLSNMDTWSGIKLERSIQTTLAGNGGSFAGLDRFNTNTSNTKQKLSFDVRGYEQPVVIAQQEADAVASSKQKSVDMVSEAIEEAGNEMADGIGGLFYGDGTGNSNKDFLGLAAIVDDGGEVDSYGGLSRAAVPAIRATEIDLAGPLTLAAMATAFDAAESGKEQPTIIITTKAIWSDYEALNQPGVRNNQDGFRRVSGRSAMGQMFPAGDRGLAGDQGFVALAFRGVPVVKDEKATSGTMWFLNERWLKFYRLASTEPMYTNIPVGGNKDIEGLYEDSFGGQAGFDWSGFIRPTDQYGRIGHILLQGNLISWQPRRHSVINGIT